MAAVAHNCEPGTLLHECLESSPSIATLVVGIKPSDFTTIDLVNVFRLLKRYQLNYHTLPGSGEVIPGNTMTMSSYAGLVMPFSRNMRHYQLVGGSTGPGYSRLHLHLRNQMGKTTYLSPGIKAAI